MKWLSDCKGVIQVGAHRGQEAKIFKHYPQLDVVYIEALPNVYEVLKQRTSGNKKWLAFNHLVTDRNDETYEFNVSNNRGGQSSSIFELGDHLKMWPNVHMVGKIKMNSITLPALIQEHNLDIKNYDVLFLDVQGAELKILEGAVSIIHNFKYIYLETWDFFAYKGACLIKDIELFMSANNFSEYTRDAGLTKEGVGSTYNITYRRNDA